MEGNFRAYRDLLGSQESLGQRIARTALALRVGGVIVWTAGKVNGLRFQSDRRDASRLLETVVYRSHVRSSRATARLTPHADDMPLNGAIRPRR